MAKEIKKWVTINGNRVPIYEDGSMGGFMTGKGLDRDRKRAKETTRNAEAKDKYQKDWNGLDDEQKADIDKQLSKNHPDWYDEDSNDPANKTDKDFMEKENERWKKEFGNEDSHQWSDNKEPEGRKTYRVHYEDGNQRLLEANSREELDAYLKETEKEYGKATKAEHAAEYDKKDTLKSTDLPFGGKSNTSDKRIAGNDTGYYIDKESTGMGDHYSLYYQHPNSGSDGLKFLGDAYGSIDKLESKLGQSVLSNKGVQDVLNQARGGNKDALTKASEAITSPEAAEGLRKLQERKGSKSNNDYIISQNSEGQELKIPRKTYEDRLKRAREYQQGLRDLKGTTPEDHRKAREQVEQLENALKTGKSVKIGNKEVGVKKELTPSELEAKARRDSAAEDTRSRRKYMQNIKTGNGTLEDYGNLNYTQSSKLTLGQLKQIAKNAGLEVPGYYTKDDIKRMLQKVWNSKN